jgi:hypothetical protein
VRRPGRLLTAFKGRKGEKEKGEKGINEQAHFRLFPNTSFVAKKNQLNLPLFLGHEARPPFPFSPYFTPGSSLNSL